MLVVPAVQASPFNPVQFTRVNGVRDIRYNTIHPGTAPEIETYAFGVAKVPYLYPAEITDTPEFQFNITLSGLEALELQLIKPLRTPTGVFEDVIHTWSYSYWALANNQYIVDGISYPQGTYHFYTAFLDVTDITPGLYYFRLKLDYSSEDTGVADRTEHFNSEPVDLNYKHLRTILISVKNNTNDYDTVFVQPDATFSMRTPGALHDFNPDAEDTFFNNQRGSIRKLYSRPGSSKVLTIGGGQGVARWVKECANYLMSADYIAVDGVEITKDGNPQWEKISAGSEYPLGGQSIAVRYAKPEQTYTTVIRPSLTLFTRTGFPYFLHTAAMHRLRLGLPEPPIVLGQGYYITDAVAEKKMLAALNQNVRALGASGTVTVSGDEIRYNNAPGEVFTVSDSVLLPYFIEATHDTSINTFASFTLSGTQYGLVWDSYKTQAIGTSSFAIATTTYNYPASGIYKTRIFHNNTIEEFVTTGTVNITGITGTVPDILTGLRIESNRLSSFDVAFLVPAVHTLSYLLLKDNLIASIANPSLFYYNGGPTGDGFYVLSTVNMSFNRLRVVDVNEMLVQIDGNANNEGITGGVLYLDGQTPPAAPSGPPLSAKADLITNLSWTVTTD